MVCLILFIYLEKSCNNIHINRLHSRYVLESTILYILSSNAAKN